MGFLDPFKLLYALSLAALVAIYLRSRSRPTIEVSSLMLFEEVAAPIAKSRVLRLDLMFWLEAAALAALTLTLGGLYMRRGVPVSTAREHALIFDLGAGMGAVDERGQSRLAAAQRAADALVAAAPAGTHFSVIGYALEAATTRPSSARPDEIRAAIDALAPAAVATRPAALRAALLRARDAGAVTLYADRPPPAGLIGEAALAAAVDFHQVGAPAANLAIVSIDPGVPHSTVGRAVVRNFSPRPEPCELVIEAGGREVFHSTLIIEPRAAIVVPFGPLAAGGLVHARIVTPDALAADNQRWALAPSIAQARALVLSPDAATRDDLARIVLAINPNYLVTAGDPAQPKTFNRATHYDLAVLHDCSVEGIDAAARLLIFPEPHLLTSRRPPLLPVTGSVAVAEMQEREGAGTLGAPVLLGPARIVDLPGWMTATARGAGVGDHDSFALAANGRMADGAVGLIAFDVRNHLLLDPDRMDALVAVVDTLKQIVAPPGLRIVATGTLVSVPAFASARITAPDGATRVALPDQWGRVQLRPLEAGRYLIATAAGDVTVMANYFDAGESDLSAPAAAAQTAAVPASPAVLNTLSVQPVAIPLIALALLALLIESIVLARRAARWGVSHV